MALISLQFVNGRRLKTMIPVNSCYLDVIGRARHLSYYDQKGMNTRYGCTNGCEAMQCGQDCFATKSGKTKNVTAFVWTTATIPARAVHRALGVTISPIVHESLNEGLLGCVTHTPQNVVTP